MNERTMRVALGLFVALALVLLTAMVVLFRSVPRLFSSTIPYTVVFPEAPGASPGTPVRRAGVRIGEVTQVGLDDTDGGGQVRVGIAVDRTHPVRHNEQATLVSGILGGDSTIDFLPKPLEPGEVPDRSPEPPGAVLVGVSQVTVNALINRASSVVPTTEKTMEDIRNSLRRLERMSPLMEETMREYRDLARDARATIPDLRKTNDDVRELSKSLREALPDFRRSADDVAATARTYTRLGERLDTLLQGNQDKIVKAIDNANEVLQRLSGFLTEENQRNVNTILKNVSAASNQIDDIAKNMADITREGRVTVRRLNDTLVRTDDTLKNIQQATKPLAEHGDSLVRNADEALVRLNRTLLDAGSLVRAIGQSDGTLNRLLTDPTLYNRLNDVLCGVQRSMPHLEQILKDFEVFADKVARHPESLGVRGAIRPDAGIK
jgi:phospholipid/cholesterol/gamma-HCH transport system substrate-binding protein